MAYPGEKLHFEWKREQIERQENGLPPIPFEKWVKDRKGTEEKPKPKKGGVLNTIFGGK